MNKYIYLYCDTYQLGSLSYKDNKFIFNVNREGFQEAILAGMPVEGIEQASEDGFPYIFEEFEINRHRSDLIKEYNILKTDNRFERLYKSALSKEKSFSHLFWISTIDK